MGDLIFVAVVVAFLALTVAYVRACERIVGRDSRSEPIGPAGDDAAEAARAPEPASGATQ
jgi:hypothetical protein